MMSINRYMFLSYGGSRKDLSGKFCLYSDHVEVVERLEREIKELSRKLELAKHIRGANTEESER